MNTGAAAIIAVGLSIGGFLAGGRYDVVASRGNEIARLDRLTGDVAMCVLGTEGGGCGFRLDPPPNSK